ncbi:MAG: hypothetical protein ACKPB0_05480, partial [Opitutaceae bacterium]
MLLAADHRRGGTRTLKPPPVRRKLFFNQRFRDGADKKAPGFHRGRKNREADSVVAPAGQHQQDVQQAAEGGDESGD